MTDRDMAGNESKDLPLRLLLKTIFLLVIVMFAYCDLAMPNLIQISDYTTTFYPAAKLIATGRIGQLYPASTDQKLAGTTFDLAAHQFLPELPQTMTAIYPYPPLTGWLLAPLSFLPPNWSLLIFQALSVCALAFSARWLCLLKDKSANRTFLSFFLFTPVILVIWIGQLDVLAGILVYAASYFLLKRERPFTSGLIASLSVLKLQFMLAPFFIAALLCLRKQRRMMYGYLAGILFLATAIVCMFGIDTCKSWLGAMSLTERVYLSPASGVARHLAISVPRFLLFLAAPDMVPLLKPIIYAAALLILVLSLFVCWRWTKNTDQNTTITLGFTFGCLLIPVIAPHLFYYDLCIMAVAGTLLLSNHYNHDLDKFFRKRTRFLWILVSCYPFLFSINRSMYLPLVILIPWSLLLIDLLRFAWLQQGLQARQEATLPD